MAEYIEREAVIDRITNLMQLQAPTARAIIEAIPVADVRPVVRGRWKDAMQSCHDSPHVKCSVCGEYYWQYFKKFNFCPNCGADMRGDEDDV